MDSCGSGHAINSFVRYPTTDFQWQYQLRHERDVTAQGEAVLALERFPTINTRKALTDIIENEQCFYKFGKNLIYFLAFKLFERCCFYSQASDFHFYCYHCSCLSTHCLAAVANAMASSWEGPPADVGHV